VNSIVLGERTNIQDNTVIHVSSTLGTSIGNRVTVGHSCILHACRIEDQVLVGMGSILMDGCRIGSQSIIAAGSVITKGKEFPARSLIVGSPARRIREVSEEEIKLIRASAEKYIKVKEAHRLIDTKTKKKSVIRRFRSGFNVIFALTFDTFLSFCVLLLMIMAVILMVIFFFILVAMINEYVKVKWFKRGENEETEKEKVREEEMKIETDEDRKRLAQLATVDVDQHEQTK